MTRRRRSGATSPSRPECRAGFTLLSLLVVIEKQTSKFKPRQCNPNFLNSYVLKGVKLTRKDFGYIPYNIIITGIIIRQLGIKLIWLGIRSMICLILVSRNSWWDAPSSGSRKNCPIRSSTPRRYRLFTSYLEKRLPRGQLHTPHRISVHSVQGLCGPPPDLPHYRTPVMSSF